MDAGVSARRYTLASPLPLHRNTFHQCLAALSGGAHDRQDDSAAARRHTGGLEHLHDLLPGRPPGRLLLRTSAQPLAERSAPGARAPGRDLPSLPGIAARSSRLDPARQFQPHLACARTPYRVRRPAVLRTVIDGAPAAEVV